MRTGVLRGVILDCLGREPGAWVSGEELSAQAGVTRAAVSKQVGLLRREGFRIEARVGQGYRFLGGPGGDCVEELPLVLGTRDLGKKGLVYRGSTDSTQNLARQAAQQGALHGTLVLAGEQTAGKGRQGAVWTAPSGSLAVSLILRPDWPVLEAPRLPVLLSLALHRALEILAPGETRIQWPCDLWGRLGKLGGILVEVHARSLDRLDCLIAGVGFRLQELKVSMSSDDGLDALNVLRRFLEELERCLDMEAMGGYPSLLEDWIHRLNLVGTEQRVRLCDGGILEGLVLEVDGWGRLGLRVSGKDQGPVWLTGGELLDR